MSPPSRTAAIIFLFICIFNIYIRVVRRALNLLRASFSPIFQYFLTYVCIFARDHAPSAIFPVMHERERYFNWFIVAAFLASGGSQRFEMGSPT